MKNRKRRRSRAGNVLVWTVLWMMAMFAVIAFAVDLGYIYTVRAEMQRTADSASLAGAWKLCDEDPLSADADPFEAADLACLAADEYAGRNPVGGAAPSLAYDDVEVGYLQSDGTINGVPSAYIAVRTNVRRTSQHNGEVPLFFARLLGKNSSAQQTEATAVFMNNIGGFQTPSSGENLCILPFALDKETWDNMLLYAVGTDDWTWNEETGEVAAGGDGVLEVNLFPQGTGSPGNRGTVDIGSNNNSTNDIARQILYGVSPEDLAHHGGSLEFDDNGELMLNGDTGISAGMKDELASIIGEPRIIPIFSTVSGPGNNAWYTIVQFAGIRIMDVKLTGKMSSKRVIIQPAKITCKGAIPAAGATQTSKFVYSPVWLSR